MECQNVPNIDLCLPSTRRYQYQGKEQFRELLGQFLDQVLDDPTTLDENEYIIFHIDNSNIERDFLDEEGSICFISFEPAKSILVVKMHTMMRQNGADSIKSAVRSVLSPMGLRKAFRGSSGVPVHLPNETEVANAAWVPVGTRYATMVLEVAVSECLARLRRDVDMWVDPARGNIKVVLMIVRKSEIKLERYEWDSIKQKSRRAQLIIIKENEGQVTVAESPLIIPFEYLLERAPLPEESDIQIEEKALKEIADDVWSCQESPFLQPKP
ncbi:uncharacterized protein PGRI_026380 [Penicillium griseofulvum]|uniref:Uncharacterized protein n=1 Tax=Penicillium patulum TaxID=5078 RepID=A0A135LIK3_PENPA|nr:uncharacterized protein PGRI_026380 [Penicillium griseofulvum]KXG48768.1 hypothetical protein PGRI_026380 [Penicillium griseofulvum]